MLGSICSGPKRCLRLTHHEALDQVFDQCLRCTNWEGRIIVVGFAGGKIPKASVA